MRPKNGVIAEISQLMIYHQYQFARHVILNASKNIYIKKNFRHLLQHHYDPVKCTVKL